MAPFARRRPSSVATAAWTKSKQRHIGPTPDLEALELGLSPATGLTSFGPGAVVIDMGQPTQTVGNLLKPDGMVYDLVQNQHIPFDRGVNSDKAVFGSDFTDGGQSYSGGSFIIEASFDTAAASAIAK
jgi:hypothetical protein